MSAHTPGEWRVVQGADPRDFIVADVTGNTIAEPNAELFNDWPELDPSVHHISVDEAMANARLMAAAPDLLAALSDLIKAFDEGIAGRSTERDHEPGWAMRSIGLVRTLSAAQAAITKAEGR